MPSCHIKKQKCQRVRPAASRTTPFLLRLIDHSCLRQQKMFFLFLYHILSYRAVLERKNEMLIKPKGWEISLKYFVNTIFIPNLFLKVLSNQTVTKKFNYFQGMNGINLSAHGTTDNIFNCLKDFKNSFF